MTKKTVVALSFGIAIASGLWAQKPLTPQPPSRVMLPEKFDVSPPLREIPAIPPKPGTWLQPEHPMPSWVNTPPETPPPFEGVHVVQDRPVPQPLMPTPLLTFMGVGQGLGGYSPNVAPPDTEGDIGPNHYVQWVNLHFAVFDRNGTLLYGPAAGNTLWTGFGGRCETDNTGDPIVQYDQFADRWVMTQFAVSTSPYYQCVAVSTSPDPLGSYYRYEYSFGNQMNDYPKFGVWYTGSDNTSAYVATYNMFLLGNIFSGAEICAYNRAQMLAGSSTATSVCFGPYSSYGSILPADVDGPDAAPANSPNYLLAFGTNSLLFWRLAVNWSGSPTLTGPTTISVAPFSKACNGGACIPQPGTTNQLDSLGDRLMYRLAYRNFGSFENLVVNHSINTSAPIAVRWYELRNLQGTPTVYQSGTYQPDAQSRWMGSAAMDGEGNLAIGYSVSSSTVYPGIRYAGRLSTDPLGTLAQGEATMWNGGGSQTGSLQRWGDYSALSVDPLDDCTFWYTNEYLQTNGSFNWSTRIGAFRFPVSKPGPNLTATANGNNRIDLSWTPVAGTRRYILERALQPGGPYTVLATLSSAVTSYTDSSVQGGVTYYYRVRHTVCTAGGSNEASATAQGACTGAPLFEGLRSVSSAFTSACQLNLSWNPATAQCGGPVYYSVYRATSPSFTPSASNRIATNLTGTSFSDANGLTSGTTYYYIVRATDSSNGVEETNTVTKSGSPYGPLTASTLLSENFDNLAAGGLPPGWGTGFFAGNANDWRGAQACPPAHSGTMVLRCGGNKCNTDYSNDNHAFTRTGQLTIPSGSQNVRLSFWHRWNFETGYDGGYLRISFDGTTYYYVPASAFISGGYNNTNDGWWDNDFSSTFTNSVVNLDAACNSALGGTGGCQGKSLYVAFVEYTDFSVTRPGWYIDDVVITADVPSSCGGAPNDVQVFTARATNGQVKLEWVNPSAGAFSFTRVCWSTTSAPTDPTNCGGNQVDVTGTLGGYGTYTHTGLANGTKYFYTAFAASGSSFADGVSLSATPFATTGAAKWAYTTAATAVAPAGIRPGALGSGGIYAVSNDRFVHAMNPTGAGGDWPRTLPFSWSPLAMNGPAQDRPPVVPTTAVPGASLVVFLGSQDGHAYAVNAQTGNLLWQSPLLAEVVQANPAGMFTQYGALWDLLFVGTRDAVSDNTIYALNPATGAILWSFNNGGGANGIGIISSSPSVDYANSRVYFSSRARGSGSSDTLWCLSVSNTGATKLWSKPLGDIDGATVLIGGRVYVGNNSGVVYAVDAATGNTLWTFSTGDGPVKRFVSPEFTASTPRKLFFATTNRVWSITDNGNSATSNWSITTIPNPSHPLYHRALNKLYVGAGNGQLYEADVNTGSTKNLALGGATTVLGPPSLDVLNNFLQVGSDAGVIYGVQAPLP